MTVQSCGGRQTRHCNPLLLAGLLLTTTALVTVPGVEAAGEILDPSRPDFHWRYVGIPAISADGTMFVGNVDDWLNDIYTAYHDNGVGTTSASGFGGSTAAYGLSRDGRYVVGVSELPTGEDRAFRWDTEQGMMLNLSVLDPGNSLAESTASDVSGDGRTIVGSSYSPGTLRAFAWIEGATTGEVGNEQMYELQGLATASHWSANALTDNGHFAAGQSNGSYNGNFTSNLATRWDLRGLEAGGTGSDTLLVLGSLAGSDLGYSVANDISADGRIVVGQAQDEMGATVAYRWVEGSTSGDADNVQMHSLGALGANPTNGSEARAVSRDGQYVVGWSNADLAHDLAFRWSDATGMESMHDWLDRNGVDRGGLILTDATAISDNGLVVAGVMTVPGEGERAYIARVTETPPPGGGGSGIMDVAEYTHSLLANARAEQMGVDLTWMPLNGAHHRPLLAQGRMEDDVCLWNINDLAYKANTDSGIALTEVGGCGRLGDGLVAGLGVGGSTAWQGLALGGNAQLAGAYVMGEIDWQPDGTPLLLSLTGVLGGWHANINRAYANGAATDVSRGSTGLMAGVVRARLDWLDAAQLGAVSINPWISGAIGRTDMGGYVESGGAFPARFDAQSVVQGEVRVGVTAKAEVTPQTTLSTTLEVAHRSGGAPGASGQVLGLFDFGLGGGNQGATWVRAGLDLDHALTEDVRFSGSLHLATQGQDATISGSLGLTGAF